MRPLFFLFAWLLSHFVFAQNAHFEASDAQWEQGLTQLINARQLKARTWPATPARPQLVACQVPNQGTKITEHPGSEQPVDYYFDPAGQLKLVVRTDDHQQRFYYQDGQCWGLVLVEGGVTNTFRQLTDEQRQEATDFAQRAKRWYALASAQP
ncbi:MAG: hypothetical protein MUC97_04110 [Bernardetiaceae bacterium]|nr:hypothetical protein [Bernardetiaceae bacterium]